MAKNFSKMIKTRQRVIAKLTKTSYTEPGKDEKWINVRNDAQMVAAGIRNPLLEIDRREFKKPSNYKKELIEILNKQKESLRDEIIECMINHLNNNSYKINITKFSVL